MDLRIHDWTFEPDRNCLRRNTESVRLEPRAADVLRVLHANAGTVLSKDALIRAVWGDVAVSEEVLTTAIYQLRRALGDDRHAPRYIETIPRRGYRLLPNSPPIVMPFPRGKAVLIVAITMGLLAIGALSAHRQAARKAAQELQELASGMVGRGENLKAAVAMLRRASELDSSNTRIAGKLALALALSDERERSADEARRAADRAVALDPSNADARVARAIVVLQSDWNWTVSGKDLEIASATGDPLARAWLAFVSALRGDHTKAVRLANAIDGPPIAVSTASTALLLTGRIDDAERVALQGLRSAPSNEILSKQIRKTRERRLERAVTLPPSPDARRPTDVARLHLAYGNPDAALAALETALRQRDGHLLYLRVDTRWEPIRSHPRFQSIVAAVGL